MTFDEFIAPYGLSKKKLDMISYESKLNLSIKHDIKDFIKEDLLNELYDIADFYDECNLSDLVDTDFRIKSIDSINFKYDRYVDKMHQVRKTFNDILGFRMLVNTYAEVLACDDENIRVVNMSNGKAIDDGYRGVHLYYQKSSKHYPIEMQFNTFFDRQLNDWLHDYVYKRGYDSNIGRMIRIVYENGKINNIDMFKKELENVLHSRKE